MLFLIENHKNIGTQKKNSLYKTGSLLEWYKSKSLKSKSNFSIETVENFNINKSFKKEIIKVKIISNKKQTLEQIINYEISKNNENETTEIEIYNDELIENLLKKYCNIKKIKTKNVYLTKKNFQKIKNKLKINQAKIENNETIFFFEQEENEDNKNNQQDNEKTFSF